MSEVTVQQPEVRLEVVKAAFHLELTQNKFQELQTAVDCLVFNEDNLPEIKEILEKGKKLKKVVDEAHKRGKEPYLEAGRLYDTAKKDYYSLIDGIFEPAGAKYTQLCVAKDARERKEREEAARQKAIRDGIQGNILAFSQKIAAATTSEQLLSVERLINLEKANKTKYAEFLEEAVEKYNEFLNQPLKDQKAKIKELEDAEAKKLAAEQAGDDAALLQLQDKTEALQAQIEENKVTTQEKALAEVTRPSEVPYATTISTPPAKAKYSKWKFEVTDLQLAAKKMPGFVELIPNEKNIQGYLDAKKAEGIAEGVEEFEFSGVRFFLDKRYI
jgi:hypothetical protein